MRITRESLIRIAKENSQERAFNDRDIVAAYLTGSLVSDADPIFGGTADIDLVFVHSQRPGVVREIVKLTPDFHLDIIHRSKDDFKSPRELRTDPMLGCEMYDPLLLYQREKFFEFVQEGPRTWLRKNWRALRKPASSTSPATGARRRRNLAGRQGRKRSSGTRRRTPAWAKKGGRCLAFPTIF